MRRSPKQDRSRAVVEAVVQAAEELLAREGPSTTTNRIAKRAGVGVASLYRYFEDKEAVFQAVATRYVARLDAAADASWEGALPTHSGADNVRRFFNNLTAVEKEGPPIGPALNRMRARGWDCPPLDDFERRLERRIIDSFKGSAELHPRRARLIEITGPLMFQAVSRTIRFTLTQDFELFQTPVFVEELTALVVSYLGRGEGEPVGDSTPAPGGERPNPGA